MQELKRHLSVEQQVELLQARNLAVGNKDEAIKFLRNVNYYRFSGYLHSFKEPVSGAYKSGTTMEQVIRLYNFDRKFTRILMFALEDIEQTLKTRTSYLLTSLHPDDPLIYLNPVIYRDCEAYNKFNILCNTATRRVTFKS